MAEQKVTVEALKYHTHSGEGPYDVGDTYEVPEADVDNLVTQGFAVRVDRVAHAKKVAEAAEASAKPAKPAKVAKVRKARKVR